MCPKKLSYSSAALAHPLDALLTLSFAPGPRSSSISLENQPTSLHYKKGAKTNPLNYRPFSICPIISTVMESIITVDMKSFLFSNSLISDHQFGFRPGTLDMLLLLTQQWMEALNVRHEISAISPSISLASILVWHPALLSKLFSDAIQGQLYSWITGFLHSRGQHVALMEPFLILSLSRLEYPKAVF